MRIPTSFQQALEALLRRQRSRVEPADDTSLERVEFARSLHAITLLIRTIDPVADGLDVEPEAVGQLRRREMPGRTAELGCDLALLGPVLPTRTHPEASGIGSEELAHLIDQSPLPVYALGGMKPELLGKACEHGAHRIALMRGFE